jgi:hypothetical protein
MSPKGDADSFSKRSSESWLGHGSRSVLPPADYWTILASFAPGPQLDQLKLLSDRRLNEFEPSTLPPPEATAVMLLDRMAADGWLEKIQRHRCPKCANELNDNEARNTLCPHCGEAFSQHGGVDTETVYIRSLAQTRDVDWVIAIHGMNTAGAWQEAFSWHLGTTWGRSVPVAVYKYGIVLAGVIMAWRRRKLQRDLRDKLAALRKEARAQGYSGNPDVIAHSFGTWLVGHIIEDELTQKPEEQLKFGRVILTGCILRPDFNWKRIKDAGLVEDVLNHYGTKDAIVPLAHATIWDSGPSGRRGFDGDQVVNVRAAGYGHSDLFAIDKCIVNGAVLQPCAGTAGEASHLEHSYKRYWRPFLTLPRQELSGLPDRVNPQTAWRPLPWPFRGTLFPFLFLPLLLALLVTLAAGIGDALWPFVKIPLIVAGISALSLGAILVSAAAILFVRRLRSLKWKDDL